MSLILEALRKSEAERQRGRAPGLFVAQSAAPVDARRTPGWAWALGALLVAVLLTWGLREWQRNTAPPAFTADAAGGAAATPVDTAAPTPRAPATAPAEVIATAPPPAALAPESAPAAVALAPAIPDAPLASASAPVAATVAAPVAAPIAAPIAAPVAAQLAAPVPAPIAPPAAAAEPAATAEPTLPSLAQLPASERAQLPALKLSMHVYADDPAQRFVILDGQRLGEGASPAAGVVLQQIRRDGLVLSVNGRQLLLARP